MDDHPAPIYLVGADFAHGDRTTMVLALSRAPSEAEAVMLGEMFACIVDKHARQQAATGNFEPRRRAH